VCHWRIPAGIGGIVPISRVVNDPKGWSVRISEVLQRESGNDWNLIVVDECPRCNQRRTPSLSPPSITTLGELQSEWDALSPVLTLMLPPRSGAVHREG